ncbi:MAG: hypothetical protein AABY84_03220 [Candidatus Firestonebacteria bacterium]
MKGITVDKVIEEFNKLPLEDEEYTIEVIKKQLIEKKRQCILLRAKEAENNVKKGLFKKGTIENLHKDLENA